MLDQWNDGPFVSHFHIKYYVLWCLLAKPIEFYAQMYSQSQVDE